MFEGNRLVRNRSSAGFPPPPTVGFLWRSGKLSGAEKRLLSTVEALNESGQPAFTFMDRRDAMRIGNLDHPHLVVYDLPKISKACSLFQKWVRQPNMRRYLRRCEMAVARRFMRRLFRSHGVRVAHISMSTKLPTMIPVPAIFEVTSPDWVDQILSDDEIVPPRMPLNAVSTALAERLRSALPDRQVFVNPGLFPNVRPQDVGQLDIGAKKNVIVFAHRLIPRKNGVLFAEAVKEFLPHREDWRVLIRGRGPDVEQVLSLLGPEIRSGAVEMGFEIDLAQILTDSKIFVSLIEPNNFPSQSVLEALIYGNALVMSKSADGESSFLADNGLLVDLNPVSVAEGLLELTQNGSRLTKMAHASRKLALSQFSREDTLIHLKNLFQIVGRS